MKRIISLLLCFILAFSIYQPALAAENTITWTGEAGDGLWHTAGNWDLERVPEEGDYVIISDSSVVEVNGNTAPVTLDCSGQISVASGGHLYLTGTSYLRTLDNDSFDKLIGDGNITIMGEGSELQCGGGIIGDGTFTIGSGAKLVIDEDATGFGVEMDWYLVNNGKLMLKSGDLYLFGGSEGEGTLTISEGAYLSFGDGAYNVGGDVLNGGVVYISVLSSVFFEANYRQENTGTTVFSVWGSEPGEYCQLNVSGQAELDGILEFDSISADYVPSPGDTFEFMTYGSRDGEFSEIISYPENINFESNYSDTSLILTVVADTTPPELTSVTPASGSTISPYIDSLTLKFNEAVWGDWEKNVTIYTADTNNLVCTLYLNNYDGQNISGNGTDTITLKVPSDTFEFGQSYYILIDEGAFVDAAGNEYAGISDSSTWALTVLNDTEPPTVPTNLRSTSKTSTSVTLEWDPSSDDYGPISYDIYGKTEAGEFVLAGSTESTSFMVIKLADTSLAPETEYTFVVRAADACDNQSEQSNQLRVTTEERPNLIWWEREIPPSSSVYYDTCYGAGKYVAVGTQGTILTSIDEGMSWQLEIGDNFGDSQLKAVTYGNDRFVAVAPSDVYTKTSTDDEWTRIELDAGTVDFNDVTCGKKKDGSGDIFVAVGRNCIWWSEDGVNWQQFLSKPYITDTFVFQEVAADEEGNFVAVGYKEGNYGNNTLLIWKSSNGKNWSSSVDSSLTGQFTGIAYGNGAFMVCGGSVTDIWISTNKGDSWEKGPLPGQDSAYVCPTKIAYGDGLFVAAAGNDVWISDNRGYTWTRSQEFEDFLVSINYCNQSFVASDWDGKIHQAVREPGAVGTIPSVPLNFTATPGDGQVALSWSAPASDGGSTILKYQVSKDNGTNWSDVGLNTTHTFTGLTNGTEYTFKVRAVNSAGNGEEASTTATPVTPEFAGGNGSEEDPYLIETVDHLNNVRNYLGTEHSDKHFKLNANLNLDVAPYNSNTGWQPIGTSLNPFTGTFDGGGYTISGLFISKEGSWNNRVPSGLFGKSGTEAKICNLILEDVDITGCYYVGSLVGSNSGEISKVNASGDVVGEWDTGGLAGSNNGSISDSSFVGTVTGTDLVEYGEWTGGLVGYNNLGTIINCWTDVTVVSEYHSIGGLVGENFEGTIRESFSKGTITGYDYTGGLVGSNNDEIISCYSTCTVNGDDQVGGLVGGNSGPISYSFAVGKVNGNSKTGGLVGSNVSGTVTGCYWDTETSGKSTSAGGTGKSTTKMKEQATYEGWNFDTVWGINGSDNNGYPFLRWQVPADAPTVPGVPQNFTATPGDGQVALSWSAPASDGGSAILKYQVSKDNGTSWTDVGLNTTHTFTGLTNGTEYTFKVRAVNSIGNGEEASTTATPLVPEFAGGSGSEEDPYIISSVYHLNNVRNHLDQHFKLIADLDLSIYGTDEGWEPIGTETEPFTGFLDGDNHNISNLFIDRPTDPKIGLFGYTGETAKIWDLGLANVDIFGNHDVGGLVGWNEGEITNSYVTGDVTGRGETGGLVGVNHGSITDSRVIGTVTDVWGGSVGGLVAENFGTITKCHAEATVISDSSYAGGLVGANYGSITESHAVGAVEGSSYVGGLVGLNSEGNIDRCYATGTATGTEDWINYTFVGGLVGYNRASISNSYARGTVSGQDDIGGLAGYNYGTISNSYSTGAVSGDNNIGGLIGFSHQDGIITNSYWDTSTSNQADSAGGTGKDTAQMKQQATYEDWDFAAVWGINDSDNDGYPFLRWQGYGAAPTAPSAPQNFTVTPGDAKVTLSWTAPTSNGGSAVTKYEVSKDNGANWSDVGLNTSYTFTGLTNGTEYTFKVRAVNSAGNGAEASVSATPVAAASVPSAPQNFTATPGDAQVRLSWSAPLNDGGSSILRYEVSSDNGSTWVTASTSTSHTFTGLTNGTEYTFKVRAVNSAGDGAEASVSATPRVHSGSGKGRTPSTPTYQAKLKAGSGTERALRVTVNNNTGNASIEEDPWSTRPQGRTIVTIPSIPGTGTYSVSTSLDNLSTTDVQGTLTLNTDAGSITVSSNMLNGIENAEGSNAQITIGMGDKSNLPADVKNAIGERPLVQLTLSIDGKQMNWSNPEAPVTVSIPYTPTEAELAHPENIVVWYIDGSGNIVTIPNGQYDPETGTVSFTTTHFSYFAVSYHQVDFKDVANDAWYAKAVSYIAAREITTGTGSGNFSPEAKLTRGQFIVMLMKAYNIAPDQKPEDNFADAGSTYYTNYLAAAKRLGISAGVGDNSFAPEKEITRQEMFTLLYNALEVIGKLPQGDSGQSLSSFSDSDDIAIWAQDAMTLLVETGIISGSGNRLSPQDTTTRAQMAQLIYNLLVLQ